MKFKIVWRWSLFIALILIGTGYSFAQTNSLQESQAKAGVIGFDSFSVQVLDFKESITLYRDILGFKINDMEIFSDKRKLVLKVNTNDLTVSLSPTSKKFVDAIGPIGNTNHNHFMLKVNDIVTIGDKLKAAGYELENENYARDKYTFFVGPNGEIIGLSAWD